MDSVPDFGLTAFRERCSVFAQKLSTTTNYSCYIKKQQDRNKKKNKKNCESVSVFTNLMIRPNW